MGKKKQEMSQVYSNSNNEFIFGENGGKGKHLSSFLKNLSLTGSSNSSSNSNSKSNDHYNDINSSIYGNFSYGANSPNEKNVENSGSIKTPNFKKSPYQRSVSGPVGASFSHLATPPGDAKVSSNSNSKHGLSSPYKNLGLHASTGHKSGHRTFSGRQRYADLDDDWDADLEEVSVPSLNRGSLENKNLSRINTDNASANSTRNSLSLQPSPMLDSLHPDLTVPINTHNNKDDSNKESLDYDDLQTKLEINKLNQLNVKYSKFRKMITNDTNISIQELRRLSWNGIPCELRAITWQILLGYLPTNKSRQSSTLKRKREEYLDGLSVVNSQIKFSDDSPSNNSSASLSSASNSNSNRDKQLYHQIKIDVKRTNPTIKLYAYPETQQSLRKILFLWAVRHPASGYVQGINDLCTPFYQIFLNNYIWQLQKVAANRQNPADDSDIQLFIPGLLDDSDNKEQELLNDPNLMNYNIGNFNPAKLSPRIISIIEADTYWCLSRVLENITDNYIHEQPGIIRQVNDLRNLISKIDLELLQHFDNEGVEFIQFAFRWMNCLLMRELSIPLIIRMWDTYLSESPLGFNNFHIYVCAAFLIKFSSELKHKDFQEILLFLQNPPTTYWTEKDIELMLSEAFIWQSLYKNASAHLR
ncbi:unnamed protein product [Debaryomyces fabryi]|nr:unnamed protein product [Debaryomyces fabryi]